MTAPSGCFVTPAEAAHRLGMHTSTLSKWVRMGYFARFEEKRKVYYDWNEIIAHPLVQKDYGKFQAQVERELETPLIKPRRRDPVSYEPLYA